MKLKTILGCLAAAILIIGCSTDSKSNLSTSTLSLNTNDETIYGLVCDGSNDTIVIFLRLPYQGTDPDTINILEASRNRRVFGQLRIGDQVAMLCNDSIETNADIVIVTQDLRGQWCYKVLPTLRKRADKEEDDATEMPDTIKKLLTTEREYSLFIKGDSVAYSRGGTRNARTSDDELPVIYPKLQRYHQWFIYNGQLVLCETKTDSLGHVEVLHADTAQFVELTPDTLVLRFASGEQSYYRKTETND